MWTVFKTCFKTRKSRDGANKTLTTDFFNLCKRKKKTYALNNWNKHFYFNDRKSFHTTQTTISLIHMEIYYENTTLTTAFWILAETFIHTIYTLQLQQPVHRLKIEILMSLCTNETTQTAMDTTVTATFWIFLAKTFMHTICKLQCGQPVYRFKAKTLVSLCTNETPQTTIFSIDSKNVLTLKTTYTTSFS